MIWLNPVDYKKQEYIELRVNAPLGEHIRLDFNPLKITDISNSSSSWKGGTVIKGHYGFIV